MIVPSMLSTVLIISAVLCYHTQQSTCYSLIPSRLNSLSKLTTQSRSRFLLRSSEVLDLPAEVVQKEFAVPTVTELINFGLPTLGIWLLQPVLSLIDTSVVGMSSSAASSVLQLAALGPGIAWIDSTSYLCQFMGMATTNLYALAISEGDDVKQKKVLSHASIIATGLGFLLFAIQYIYAKPVVTLLAGSAVQSIPYALSYSRIRSFASIIAVPTIVGQAAFLASKDSITPLKAVFLGSVINIVGDLILVCGLGQGIVGAAYATMFSQFGSAIYLLWASISKINATSSTSPAINTTEKEDANVSNSNSNSNSNRDEEIKTGRTYKYSDESSRDKRKSEKVIKKQKQKENLINLVQYPGYKDFKQFLSFCGPLFFVLLTKAFSWSYTTYACSTAGPVGLAAHQIVLNIFCLFAIFGDAISQTAQTYLPPFLSARNMTKKLFNDGKTTINNIMKTAFAAGFFNSIFAFFVVTKYGQKLFTKSVEVNASTASIVLYLSAAIFPNTIMAGLEGVIIATRDVTFHSLTYLVTGAIMLAYQTFVRRNSLGLEAVWQGIVAFSWVRLGIMALRVNEILGKKLRALDNKKISTE